MKTVSNIQVLDRKLNGNSKVTSDIKHFPPEHPSLLFQALSYLVIAGVVTPTIGVFMNLLNRTRISGRENISKLKPPWILASNHLTLLDDLFLEPIILFPHVLRGFNYFPYHAPEETNFYKKPLITWFMRQCKSIPLIRGNGIHQEGMERLIRAVKNGGILHIYPEGTRTRNGDIGSGKPGIGRIVSESKAPVIPIFHQGLEKVLPIGKGVPRIGNEIRITIGKPMYFDTKIEPRSEIRTWRSISNQIIDNIRELRTEAEKKWGFKPIKMRSHQVTKK